MGFLPYWLDMHIFLFHAKIYEVLSRHVCLLNGAYSLAICIGTSLVSDYLCLSVDILVYYVLWNWFCVIIYSLGLRLRVSICKIEIIMYYFHVYWWFSVLCIMALICCDIIYIITQNQFHIHSIDHMWWFIISIHKIETSQFGHIYKTPCAWTRVIQESKILSPNLSTHKYNLYQ